MPFTTEKDVNIYYEANGSGTPLVFIHPPGMSHATFVEQHPLAKSCQLILIDLPGNGYSTKLDAVSMENLTRYVLAVLESSDWNRSLSLAIPMEAPSPKSLPCAILNVRPD